MHCLSKIWISLGFLDFMCKSGNPRKVGHGLGYKRSEYESGNEGRQVCWLPFSLLSSVGC